MRLMLTGRMLVCNWKQICQKIRDHKQPKRRAAEVLRNSQLKCCIAISDNTEGYTGLESIMDNIHEDIIVIHYFFEDHLCTYWCVSVDPTVRMKTDSLCVCSGYILYISVLIILQDTSNKPVLAFDHIQRKYHHFRWPFNAKGTDP